MHHCYTPRVAASSRGGEGGEAVPGSAQVRCEMGGYALALERRQGELDVMKRRRRVCGGEAEARGGDVGGSNGCRSPWEPTS